MAWVQIQHAAQHTWEDHERVGVALGDIHPDGLILRAAGEVDGRWKAVSIWESREAYDVFVQQHIIPAIRETFGEDALASGPPPTEWFEIKQMTGADQRANQR
jgi:enterochelin esterase-like enzyme